MQKPGVLRIVQWVLAVALLAGMGLCWRFNQMGQNLINLTACGILLVGIDNIIIYYRCYLEKSAFEAQATFIIMCFFMLGIIFESFNRSEGEDLAVNRISWYMIFVILILNASYYTAVILILIGYLVRQLYRLMTETLLSASNNLQRTQLQVILNNKKPFREIKRQNPAVNNTCSICLQEFEDDHVCIMLPGCGHCFNDQCIEEWLSSKSTCPYCRHNIRLDII